MINIEKIQAFLEWCGWTLYNENETCAFFEPPKGFFQKDSYWMLPKEAKSAPSQRYLNSFIQSISGAYEVEEKELKRIFTDQPKFGLTEKAQTLHRTYEILAEEPAEISFYTEGEGEWEATITSELVDVTERGETAEEVEVKVLDRAITDLKQLIDPNGLGVTITDALKWGEEFEMLTRTETRHSNAEWELVHAKDHQAALACALNYNADTALFKDKVHMLRHGEEGEASFTAYFVSLPIKDEEGREYDGQVWMCVNSWEIFPIAKPLYADNLEQATFQFNLFIQKSEECYA